MRWSDEARKLLDSGTSVPALDSSQVTVSPDQAIIWPLLLAGILLGSVIFFYNTGVPKEMMFLIT